MRAFFENKRWILLIATLALAALMLLAVGLQNVSFRESQPLGQRETGDSNLLPPILFDSLRKVSITSQIIAWVSIFFLVILISMLFSPEMRKKLIRMFIRAAVTVWLLNYLFQTGRLNSLMDMVNPQVPGIGRPGDEVNIPPPEFVPPHVTPLLSYVISFGVALSLLVLAWWLYRYWARNSIASDKSNLSAIAKIVRSSLRDLSDGRDSTDVIMNCYYRMSDVVSEKRRLIRSATTTPAEFAVYLESAGLPGDAVKRLTRLFENVRYGNRKSGSAEVNEAVACLTTILHYCGETI